MREFFIEDESNLSVDCMELTLSEEFQEILKENNLQVLEDFMSLPRDNSFRDVPNRLTVGLDLKSQDKTIRIYLKRHWEDQKKKSTKPHFEAKSEADNLLLLRKCNIPVPDMVAVGWGYIDQRSVGFVGINEVPGLQGDHFIEKYKSQDNWPQIEKDLTTKLAVLSKGFHGQGFNHRDFYLCHFFVDLDDKSETHLNLIDLQRVQKRSMFRERWIVKDLSQMCYSSLKLVSNSTRLSFYYQYAGISKLDKTHKKLLRKVLKKVARLVRREKEGKNR